MACNTCDIAVKCAVKSNLRGEKAVESSVNSQLNLNMIDLRLRLPEFDCIR